ncbi:MAG TPA: condensation domain-containing protein, partial [Thermoanaerobaculia bacterium]
CPMGVTGELLVSGGLARGYLEAPDLTAERFVPLPWGSAAGERMYRTGDLARHRPDGMLEFAGRIDFQVKVRGFRVELGEIDAALASHPQVREAVTVNVAPAGRPVSLVAFWSPQAENLAGGDVTAELRGILRDRLPPYMMPADLVALAVLPRTRTGKVDRNALASLGWQVRGVDGSYLAPRTPVEEVIAAIWADLLELPRVGALDHFFELGGHSLLATQVISRLRTTFRVEMPLRALFEQPTVKGLGALIERILVETRGGSRPAPPPLMRMAGEPQLSFAQERLWFLDQLEPGGSVYNIPAAVRLRGKLDPGALERSLAEITRRHAVLRTRFAVVDGRPVPVVETAAMAGLPVIDLSALPPRVLPAETASLARAEQTRPFTLAARPPIRAALLRLGSREHLALLTVHHIASDMWSEAVLVRELAVLYESFQAGRPSPLFDLPVQYADYAAWQRSWLQGAVLEEQLGYWRGRLEGAPPELPLPRDRPRPARRNPRAGTVSLHLAPELAERLAALYRHRGVTLFMTLLAAFQATLGRSSGQDDVVVGSPIANRTREETEGLIGFFVNTLALRTDLSGDPGFGDLLDRVREVALGAYAYQDLPFERLVAELET